MRALSGPSLVLLVLSATCLWAANGRFVPETSTPATTTTTATLPSCSPIPHVCPSCLPGSVSSPIRNPRSGCLECGCISYLLTTPLAGGNEETLVPTSIPTTCPPPPPCAPCPTWTWPWPWETPSPGYHGVAGVTATGPLSTAPALTVTVDAAVGPTKTSTTTTLTATAECPIWTCPTCNFPPYPEPTPALSSAA